MPIRAQSPILMGGLAGSCSRPRWGIQQKVFWVKDNPVPKANPRKDRSTRGRQTGRSLGEKGANRSLAFIVLILKERAMLIHGYSGLWSQSNCTIRDGDNYLK